MAASELRRIRRIIGLPENVHEAETGIQLASHNDREKVKTSLVVIGTRS
jgi:hypothetical protein